LQSSTPAPVNDFQPSGVVPFIVPYISAPETQEFARCARVQGFAQRHQAAVCVMMKLGLLFGAVIVAFGGTDGAVHLPVSSNVHPVGRQSTGSATAGQVVGNASNLVDGSRLCTLTQCQMGELVCQSLLNYQGPQKKAQVCITNGDSINASISAGSIYSSDVKKALPFPDLAIVLEVPGSTLLAALEHGFRGLGNMSSSGQYPQVGGLNVTVDYTAPAGSRVRSVLVGGEPLASSQKYTVVTNSFLADGGYGYSWKGYTNLTGKPSTINSIVEDYLRTHNPYEPVLPSRVKGTVIAKSTSRIDGSSKCLTAECQLGDLACDALLAHADAQLCIVNGGTFSGSIDAGNITPEDVYKAIVFADKEVVLRIPGSTILSALEHGVNSANGSFPQVAGLKYTYDPKAKSGSRVSSVSVGSSAVVPSKEYVLVTVDYLANGGDGYTWPGSTLVKSRSGDLRLIVEEYLSKRSPYTSPALGRITTTSK
jgi:2',3'-cyclic-nucleotide 2'-phosphodiesterase (5'-nucleotidase family)